MIFLFPRWDMLIPWRVTIKQMANQCLFSILWKITKSKPKFSWSNHRLVNQGPQAFVPVHAASPAKLLGAPFLRPVFFWEMKKKSWWYFFSANEDLCILKKTSRFLWWKKTDVLPAFRRNDFLGDFFPPSFRPLAPRRIQITSMEAVEGFTLKKSTNEIGRLV